MALAHETSASRPGAATMSPARNTPSPRSTAGRSRQVVPGMSSAPERASITCRRRQVVALAPVLAAGVEQALQAQRGLIGALARADRHLRLDQLLAGGRDRGIGRGVAPDPARLVHVGDDRRIAAAVAQAQVEAHGAAALPAQALVAEQLARLRRARSRRSPACSGSSSTRVAGLDLTPSSRTRRSSEATSVLQPPTG